MGIKALPRNWPANRFLIFFLIAIAGCLLDLWTKHWAFARLEKLPAGAVEWIWSGYFGLQTSLNEGALFGMGQGMVLVFAVLSVLAAIGILGWLFLAGAAKDLLLTVALGAITAGIFGNLYDRLGMHGLTWPSGARAGEPVYAVRDWILFQASEQWRWPNFNLADSLLVLGAGLLIWHAFFSPGSSASSAHSQASKSGKK